MTRLVLANAPEDFQTRFTEVAVGEGVGVSRVSKLEGPDAVRNILAQDPTLVVIGVEGGTQQSLDILDALDVARPGLWSMLVAEPGAEMWQRALRSGARDLLAPSADAEEIRAAVTRAVERNSSRSPEAADIDLVNSQSAGGRVVTIVSPKGGCGKTMLATSLAYGLQRGWRGKLALVDLDLQFGDVAGALGLKPEYSVKNAIQAGDDPTAVKAFLTPHPSGLFALCAPANPAEADSIQPEQIQRLLETLKAEFDWIIVDTSAGVSEANLIAVEASTDVIMVATTDLAAISALRKAVVVFDQIQLTNHRRWYILNRANARVGLDQSDIESAVGLVIDASVPSGRAVPTAMNQGITVLEDDPRSPAARSIEDLLQKLAPQVGAQHAETRSWLQRMRS